MPYTVELDAPTAEMVQALAAALNRSASEIIREAVTAYARPRAVGIGQYRSGQSDGSAKARDLLREAVRAGQWP